MKKNLTELVMILDRSGSMGGLEEDTIGGYNGMLEKQRGVEGEAFVTTVLFDHETKILHDRVPIGEISKLTTEDYFVRGSTALLDAVGSTIEKFKMIHRYAREEDIPEKTIFVITTDGMENSSTSYDYDDVKRLIEYQKEAEHWEFFFLGANIDAEAEAGRIGIKKDRAVRYRSDKAGTRLNYDVMAKAVEMIREESYDMAAPSLDGNWKAVISSYYEEGDEDEPGDE